MLLISYAGTVLIGSAILVALARALSRAELGTFAALLAVGQAVGLVAELGLGTYLLRELSAVWTDPGRSAAAAATTRMLVRQALEVTALGGLIGVLASGVIAITMGLEPRLALALCTLVVYAILLVAASTLESYLRARRQVGRVAAAAIVEKVTLLLLATAVVIAGADVLAIAACHVVAGLVRIAYVAGSARLGILTGAWGGQPRVGKRALIRGSAPFAINIVALNLLPRLDVAIVSLYSAAAAGYYSIGDRIITLAFIVPTVASATLYPYAVPRSGQTRAGWRVAGTMGAFGVVLAVVGIALAPAIVPAVFGEKYEPSVETVQIMLLAVPLVYAANPLMTLLYVAGSERRLGPVAMPATVVGSVGVAAGAASAGAEGAAIGFVGRYVLFFGVLVALYRWRSLPSTVQATEGAR